MRRWPAPASRAIHHCSPLSHDGARRVATMNEARRRYWKDKFEEAWRAGDKEAMKISEEMLEAYAQFEALMIEERMKMRQEKQA